MLRAHRCQMRDEHVRQTFHLMALTQMEAEKFQSHKISFFTTFSTILPELRFENRLSKKSNVYLSIDFKSARILF
jgi:hypothetical protein